MKFRFTIKELEHKGTVDYKTDLQILRALVVERQSTLNMSNPLHRHLSKIYSKLDAWIRNSNEDL